MRRNLLRVSIVAVLICGATVAFGKLTGPPKGVTGAPSVGGRPAEPNCQLCHDPEHPLNDASGVLEILDLPEQFDVNTSYPVRVRLTHAWGPLPGRPHWGFQLTAVRADSGTRYGTFVPGTGAKIVTENRPGADPLRTYISHDATGLHQGEPGPVEWSFTWQSPPYTAPKVFFFAAGNSANGDSLSSNDYIFTTSDSTTFVNAAVPLPAHGRHQLAAPAPNPVRGRTELRYALARAGTVDLAVFDLSGRRVRTLVRGVRAAGPGVAWWDARDDVGRQLGNGIYFARLFVDGVGIAAGRKITLAR